MAPLQHHAAARIETEGYVPSRKQPGCTSKPLPVSPQISQSVPCPWLPMDLRHASDQTPPPHSPSLAARGRLLLSAPLSPGANSSQSVVAQSLPA
jgi:hypothetical protein